MCTKKVYIQSTRRPKAMRITQEADYAIRMCCFLSTVDGTADATTIAESAFVPQRFALKILRKLAHNGVVISRKGACGGYGLKISADELSILKIVSSIDGEMAISKCLSPDYCCSRNPDKKKCRMHRVFCYLNAELARKLDRLTVADIAQGDKELPELIEKINGTKN